MTKFEPAHVEQEKIDQLTEQMVKQWNDGHKVIRQCFQYATESEARVAIAENNRKLHEGCDLFLNDTYQVQRRTDPPDGVWLSIKRIDRQPIHDWRDLQEIKNQLIGPQCEAIELYPAESRLTDTANQYHLWGISNPEFRFPFGFPERIVCEDPIGNSVNRPFETKPQ